VSLARGGFFLRMGRYVTLAEEFLSQQRPTKPWGNCVALRAAIADDEAYM
jgi:hypothetical protein